MPNTIMITTSREAALEQIEKFLGHTDKETLFKSKYGEFRIDKADGEYRDLTGHSCVITCIGQGHEYRLAGLVNLEAALRWAGLKLSKSDGAKARFKLRHASLIERLQQ
ncbi:hypothetical protein [Vibrio campbellii]|uniref:hypothetical protein n=1 Tax=Vibrio campbellii TaxID=680 RepID=UPI00210BBEF2|nr:hypothetical protein [Vibrio campbellii]UTZ44558.1 hypothetical protein HB764_25190 [Vibrio campbellii]